MAYDSLVASSELNQIVLLSLEKQNTKKCDRKTGISR